MTIYQRLGLFISQEVTQLKELIWTSVNLGHSEYRTVVITPEAQGGFFFGKKKRITRSAAKEI
jgi:hypothetical protein